MLEAENDKAVLEDFSKKVASGNVIEKEAEDKSYTHWTKFYQHKNSWTRVRQLFSCALAEDIEELINKEVVKMQRTKRDNFTFADKLLLHQKQNKKTREGDDIKALDIYLGVYEADHVVSVNDGGPTAIENGELMTAAENRKKGAYSNQPHFDFQM